MAPPRRGAPLAPLTVPIGERPADWNLTTIAPPKNYNVLKARLGFHDFYNLRRPDVPEEEQTAEMRNLRAWRDANFRMPFDTLEHYPESRWFNLQMPFYEFATGFFFGSIFAVFWRGPATLRFLRRIRHGKAPAYGRLERWEKVRLWARFAKRSARVPLLFGVFQLLLRGINPLINSYHLPWIVGLTLIGLNHIRNRRKRMRWHRFWNRYRSLGDIHAIEYRSILVGSLRTKWRQYFRAFPIRWKRRIWRGMIIIMLIEALILPYYHEDRRYGQFYLNKGLTSFGIMASPTFGPDPAEVSKRKAFKRPEAPMPVIDGATYTTAWLWHNNSPRSGAAYVPDERMFSLPDLRPLLEDSPEQALKFDDTALKAMDHTPAFHLGQQVRWCRGDSLPFFSPFSRPSSSYLDHQWF